MSMMGGVLQPDIIEKLSGLKEFRDYQDRLKERLKAKATAEAKAEVKAEAAANTREAVARSKADDLTQFFISRRDKLSDYALTQINECKDVDKLRYWLHRAYAGETASEIFPEP